MEVLDEAFNCFTVNDRVREEADEEDRRNSVFSMLKTYCLELLDVAQNPRQDSSAIPGLLHLIRNTSTISLQPFFDYTLFPLLLLLDAAVDSRNQQKGNPQERTQIYGAPNRPHKVSDKVAEGVIQCLEELLKKCPIGSVDQLIVVLKKLTNAALLIPSETAEEFREGVIKCFRAMILSLLPCSRQSCACKESSGLPTLLDRQSFQTPFPRPSKYGSGPGECLLAFLRSQSASAAVGHWLSLLLRAADTEAMRGHRGSSNLRVEAFLTLRVLVAKVGTADALAFFLPGVVSQFAKVLHVSKMMISGAAGSAEAMDHTVRGLAEYLMIVLNDNANSSSVGLCIDVINSGKHETTHSVLEELRRLPFKEPGQSKVSAKATSGEAGSIVTRTKYNGNKSPDLANKLGSLHVDRTREWIEKTASHVNKLLCATFPHICLHPATKVRGGLLAAIRGLLTECSCTLKESKLMLLECLCVLAVDDSHEVSLASQVFLEYLFSGNMKHLIKDDVAEIFSRLTEKLPKVVLGSEESLAHAQKLLVVIYYSGPQVVVDHLRSPITAARFLDAFALCLNQNSTFTGSLDKLISARSSSLGNKMQFSHEDLGDEYELPHMPPWFDHVGGQKLYQSLAGILRLVGLSLMADFKSGGHLSVIIDIPLGHLRKLISEIRAREYSRESWKSWYNRTGSGQLVRQASTAACILNEMIFGLSDHAVSNLTRMFQKSRVRSSDIQEPNAAFTGYQSSESSNLFWKNSGEGARSQLIDCIGKILHEFQSSEVWDLPVVHKSSQVPSNCDVDDISLHFIHDIAMLHQVIIEGIGIFSISLGSDFACSGFLHKSLYMLLENLVCSNFQVNTASGNVLHLLRRRLGHRTIGHLVLENADYIIDSICRQLRHLDMNPHVPNVLCSMISYGGVAHKILPLLEEPMRSVSQELEIIGRHQHPNLTVPFLKAVREIAKASVGESGVLSYEAKFYCMNIKSKASDTIISYNSNKSHLEPEEWEKVLFELNDSKRYRRTVASVAGSCLTAGTPLLASPKPEACLVALDIVEYGISALANVEDAYRHEMETKEAIEEVVDSCSLYALKDIMDVADDSSENKLLPAMNKLWPFLVICVQNRNPVVVRKCLSVIESVVKDCGGDFFSRRFHTDGSHFWKLVTTSPFHKLTNLKHQTTTTPLQLPYRKTISISSEEEESLSESSSLKVQAAMLNTIGELSRNDKTASALEVVLKKVSGLVVGIACSDVSGLKDASVNALQGLASMDPDLIWILLADVYYSLKKTGSPSPPDSDFPVISKVLPPPPPSKEFLYVVYGGKSYGFDVDFASVEYVFKRMHSLVFSDQMYM